MRRPVALGLALTATMAWAGDRAPSLADYRYFRALSIDLQGRPPTTAELAAFDEASFSVDRWIDTHLAGDAYAARLERVYMDVLRLDLGPSFQFVPNPMVLRREQVLGPDGAPIYVYFRRGQRRLDPLTDGDFCMTAAETGLQFPANAAPIGTATPIARGVLDARTVVVKPWWLYADYRASEPSDLVGPDWPRRFPGFLPAQGLLVEPDGKARTLEVRVCREEAQTADTGIVFASGRTPAKKGDPLPPGRFSQPPNDSAFAKQARGRAISCATGTGFQSSPDCGCGVGLEHCMPGAGRENDPPAFVLSSNVPLGASLPFDDRPQPASAWLRAWWGEEARHFLDQIFLEDRDFREVLTARGTELNGPLAQFYRFIAGDTCCGPAADAGYTSPDPLLDPGAVPAALVPEDTATWLPIADRGPHASGILTMPIFLAKYGSRRARAHVLYNAFLCKDFIADAVKLAPSDDPDLTKRPGCSACHETLEPLAAYFTRVAESDWTWIPSAKFPATLASCKGGFCKPLYDPAFSALRGAYAAPGHADDGPAGLAREITTAPEFAPCVVSTVAQSLLGRSLAPEDAAWRAALAKTFVESGYRMKALVRAIVRSPQYRDANDEKP